MAHAESGLRQQAWEAFQRDLPRLYAERPEQWVAYRGTEVVGFGAEKLTLHQDCASRGLRAEEVILFCIEPQYDEIEFGPRVFEDSEQG